MDEKIEEKVGKDLYNDLSSIMGEEYEKRMLITPSYCANKLLEKGYRKESDTAKEILTELVKRAEKISFFDCRMGLDLDELAKKYGVDLGE